MAHAAKRWTVEDVLALPNDGNRYEVVSGELLVTPSPTPRHQLLIGRLHTLLAAYLERNPVGTVFMSPVDYYIDGDAYVQPDVFVIPGDLASLPDDWRAMPRPLLVVEVLSPGSLRGDRHVKRRRYQQAGVDEYWIVDPEWRAIERWRPSDGAGEMLPEHLEWQPEGATEPLRIDVPFYFTGIGLRQG